MVNISGCQKEELPRNKQLERTEKEVVVAQFRIPSLDVPGRTEANHTTLVSVACLLTKKWTWELWNVKQVCKPHTKMFGLWEHTNKTGNVDVT
jgi:hypothetical protein